MSKNLKLALGAFLFLSIIWITRPFLNSPESQSAASIKSQTSTPIAKESTVKGVLVVSHGDDFINKVSIPYYFIQKPDGKLTELTIESKEGISEDQSGSVVSVVGTQTGDKIKTSSIANITFSSPPPSQLKTGLPNSLPITKKVAVILFNFQNNTNNPYSVADAKKTVFTEPSTNPQAVNGFFKEVSFGKMQLGGKIDPTGDVFGIYTIPYDDSSCSFMNWGNSADSLAVADGFNSSGYNAIIYIFPGTASCGWGGISTGVRAWSNGGWYGNIVHELGHSLWFFTHSNALLCKDQNGVIVAMSNDCLIKEYADPFDIMANATLKHFNNGKKDFLNFFNSQQITNVTQSGTYTLYPPETPINGPQVIRIPIETDISGNPVKYYYLELRRTYGVYDNFASNDPVVSGITIRVVGKSRGQTYVVDTTPNSNLSNDYVDSPLAVGQSFVDIDRGITITNSSITNSTPTGSSALFMPKATINIGITNLPCTRANPTYSGFPTSLQGYRGQVVSFNYIITNNDSATCATSVPTKFSSRIWSGPTPQGLFLFSPYSFSTIPSGQSTASEQFTVSCYTANNDIVHVGHTRLSPFYYSTVPFNPFYPISSSAFNIPFTLIPQPANSPSYCPIAN